MGGVAILEQIGADAITVAGLDEVLSAPRAAPLTILFLWGRNCPNCDIAKAEIGRAPDRFRWDAVRWLQCNVYDDPEMATRFGLHGIPVFLVFRGRRPIGRITAWPGTEDFVAAIQAQIRKPGALST